MPDPSSLLLSATVTGPAHERTGEPGQDAIAWRALPGDAIVVAIADGAGSARLGAVGAQTAAAAAVAEIASAWEGTSLDGAGPVLGAVCRRGAAAARQAVLRAAAVLEVRPRELASTLIVAVWDRGRAAAAHVGDGAVTGRLGAGPEGAEGAWVMISRPEPSEYVNETRFLTDDDWEGALRVSPDWANLEAIVLFSDGCQRAALRRRRAGGPLSPDGGLAAPPSDDGAWEPFAPFLDPILRFARSGVDAEEGSRELTRLLDSAKLRGVSEDDKTLAVICRPAGGGTS